MQRLCMISFTAGGVALERRLYESRLHQSLQLAAYTTKRLDSWKLTERDDSGNDGGTQENADHWLQYTEDVKTLVGACFRRRDALLFIGAAGIAVRMIAPYVDNKLTDSAVLVMDERAGFVIPLLSGHVGGANELAERIAEVTAAVPVITTATDVNALPAIDVMSKKAGLRIADKEGIAKISAKVLAHKPLRFYVAPEYQDLVDVEIGQGEVHTLLSLIPQVYILGIGCRKDKDPQELREFVEGQLRQLGIAFSQVRGIASIDLKADEPAICRLAREEQLDTYFYTAQELQDAKGAFAHSAFVHRQVGVDNVCERAAALAGGDSYEWVLRKCASHGMTLAIVKSPWRMCWSVDKNQR